MDAFSTLNLKSLYGGWVLYRNGQLFAHHFATNTEAKAYAKRFCELNQIRFTWAK